MATKVALTAEEFRENSQRSIALFNTEKLSTDSTHVLKSAYCILCISAVAICTERVEAKFLLLVLFAGCKGCNLRGACGGKVYRPPQYHMLTRCNLHGACGGKVKRSQERGGKLHVAICTGRAEKPNGIIPLVKNPRKFMQTYCIFIHLGV